jgi:N utilization substance protein B
MRRRVVREKVLQALYAYEIARDPVEHVINCILVGLKDNKTSHTFARNLVIKTIEHSEEIDKIIAERVDNWDFSRIAMLDRLILRMSICELMFFKEIPPKVTMNEAIELAKLFSTARSGLFVNGILDAILAEMKETGHLPKSGRGLYEGAPPKPGKSQTKHS